MSESTLTETVKENLLGLRNHNPFLFGKATYVYDFAEYLAENLPNKVTGREFNIVARQTLAEVWCVKLGINLYREEMGMHISVPEKYASLTKLTNDDYDYISEKIKTLATMSLPSDIANDVHWCWTRE